MKRIMVILTAMLVAFLMGGSWAWAGDGKGQDEHVPVNVCHATSSDSNPFVFITVDDDSVKLRGHLMHRNDPNKTWKSDGLYNGVEHSAGDPKPDRIESYTGTDGVFHELDGTFDNCDDTTPVQPKPEVTVDTQDRMSCEAGVEEQTITTTTEYVWEDGEWVLGEPVVEKGDWTFVRDLTKAEQKELGCENEPRPITLHLKQHKADCDGNYLRVVSITTLDGKVISKEKSKWVKVSDITKDQKSELECLTPIDEPTPTPTTPSKAQNPPKTNQPELPHTGGNLTLAGIAAGLLAAGSGMVWFSRRLTGV